MIGDALHYALGFLVSSLYWPGIAGAASTPRWAALFIIVPLLLFDRKLAAPHWALLAFVGIAAASLLWTPAQFDGMGELFVFVICAALFFLGSQTDDLRPFIVGCVAGLGISSAICILQAAGIQPMAERALSPAPFGLFVNGNYLAEAAALVAVAAAAERMWWALPVLAPALILPQARGAVLAVAIAAVAYFWNKSRVVSVALCLSMACIGVWVVQHLDGASSERLTMWQSTIAGLTFWGHGVGSFWMAYPAFDQGVIVDSMPAHPHNEFLHIAFELGTPGVLAALAFCLMLAGPIDTSRLILVALLVEACFAFPLHLPTTAAIGFIAAGHAVRTRYLLGSFALRGRGIVPARVAMPGLWARTRSTQYGGANHAVSASVSNRATAVESVS